jgi:hypothetical protein
VDSWRERERALRRLDVDVELISAAAWDEGGAQVQLVPQPDEQVTGIRTWGRHPALFLYDPRPIWRAMGRPWDVIDIHEEPFALATAELLLLRRLRRQAAPYTLYSAQNLAKRYPAPFCWLEKWALRHAAGQAGYGGGFVDEYLVRVIYPPGLTPSIQLAIAIGLVVVNLALYAWAFAPRRPAIA